MAAVAKEIINRAPYKTKKYYEALDKEWSDRIPIGSRVEIRRGRGMSECKTLSLCRRGKIEVINLITGKQYWASIECMRNPNGKSPEQMRAAIAEERSEARSRSSIVSLFLKPINDPHGRSDEARERREQVKLMPLSSDELVAYTALGAITKTLNRLHTNADSFRDQTLFDLLQASQLNLGYILREMEGYNELPADA